ncbi:MAG TPA: protein phosphatase 2C domain-containing protein [Bryobacteraceae bacterium]
MPHHRGIPARLVEAAREISATTRSSALEVEFALLSDPGRVRGHNEDFLGHVAPEAPERGWLFTVADGVGGQEFGEVASRAAVEALMAGYRAAASGDLHSALLPRLVQAANIKVYETGRSAGPGGVAMATTIVACALRHDRATIAHVGDSRCYLIRHNRAMSLTRDHTVVNDQVRLGVMSAREAAKAETRHVLSRSLGMDLFVNVDVSEHHVMPGDVLLLCSDGLHGPVPPAEIARTLGESPALEQAARALIELANKNDGSDNVSVLLIRIRSVERVGMYRGRPYKLR